MRGGAFAVEQSRCCQDKHAGTDGDQACAGGMRRAQQPQQALRRRFLHMPAGNHDGADGAQHAHTVRRLDPDARVVKECDLYEI